MQCGLKISHDPNTPSLPRDVREEPVPGVVALADGEHEVAVGVEGGVPLPQAVLPVPVPGEEEPARVPRVRVGDVELRRRPVRDADLPHRGARPRGLEHEVAGVTVTGEACM